jgi:hypothetical protein
MGYAFFGIGDAAADAANAVKKGACLSAGATWDDTNQICNVGTASPPITDQNLCEAAGATWVGDLSTSPTGAPCIAAVPAAQTGIAQVAIDAMKAACLSSGGTWDPVAQTCSAPVPVAPVPSVVIPPAPKVAPVPAPTPAPSAAPAGISQSTVLLASGAVLLVVIAATSISKSRRGRR